MFRQTKVTIIKDIFIFYKAPKPVLVPNQPPSSMNDNLLEIFVDIVHKILIYLGNSQKPEVVNILMSGDTSRDLTSKRARPLLWPI
jgi:hypothetical protein